MGATTCAIFLSLRYHKLNPKYIHERVKLLGKQYKLRVLILQMDTKESHSELQTLNRLCILVNLTLMLCWSAEEAASLIETYKVFVFFVFMFIFATKKKRAKMFMYSKY